jgi:hypothetical protein
MKTPPASHDTGGVFMLSPLFEVAALEVPTVGEAASFRRLPIFNRQFPRCAGFPGNRREARALFGKSK